MVVWNKTTKFIEIFNGWSETSDSVSNKWVKQNEEDDMRSRKYTFEHCNIRVGNEREAKGISTTTKTKT